MLITAAHLLALHECAAGEAAEHPARALAEDDPQEHVYRELELQGLVQLEVPRAYRLTYAGREAFHLLEAMRETGLLPPLDQLENDWRFIGSDILAALQAAQRNRGKVGPQAALRAYSVLVTPRFIEGESPEQVRTFAITEAESELLAAIQQLAEPANGSHLHP
jgi:hypothetical protein